MVPIVYISMIHSISQTINGPSNYVWHVKWTKNSTIVSFLLYTKSDKTITDYSYKFEVLKNDNK